MWAQIKDKENIYFTKNEKKQIMTIEKILKEEQITSKTLFQYGLYSVMVAAEIKNMNRKQISKMYHKMPIKNRQDLKLSFLEILNISGKEPKEVKILEDKLINMILTGTLKNKKTELIKQITKESDINESKIL